MQVQGKNLFSLQNVYGFLREYYMDSDGEVYSTRRGPLQRLSGSKSRSGYHTYTLSSNSFDAKRLRELAMGNPLFRQETKNIAQEKTIESSFNAFSKAVDMKRSHAPSLEEGIKLKGYIIASLTSEGKLYVNNSPAVHLTNESVRSEMERLARNHPGTKFIKLKIEETAIISELVWQ